jgi:hypothetical protein
MIVDPSFMNSVTGFEQSAQISNRILAYCALVAMTRKRKFYEVDPRSRIRWTSSENLHKGPHLASML